MVSQCVFYPLHSPFFIISNMICFLYSCQWFKCWCFTSVLSRFVWDLVEVCSQIVQPLPGPIPYLISMVVFGICILGNKQEDPLPSTHCHHPCMGSTSPFQWQASSTIMTTVLSSMCWSPDVENSCPWQSAASHKWPTWTPWSSHRNFMISLVSLICSWCLWSPNRYTPPLSNGRLWLDCNPDWAAKFKTC